MAEKYNGQAQGYPLAPPTMPRSDQENTIPYTSYQPSHHQTKRRKRIRCLIFVATLASTLAVTVLVIALVFGRVTTPRVRLVDVALTAGGLNTTDHLLTGRISVRNRNFGQYEFDGAMATVRTASGTGVGQFVIHEARVRARSTRRIYVIADLSGPLGPNRGGSGFRVETRLRGEVRLLRVWRRNRTAVLNCTVTVELPINGVQNLRCE